MKLFYSAALTFAFILSPSTSSAINKCVVDGKTRYQNGSCPKGSESKFSGPGVFSALGFGRNYNGQEKALRQENAEAQYQQLAKKVKRDQEL